MTDPMADLERQLKPYRDQVPSFTELPADGLVRAEVTSLVERLAAAEEGTWREGYASGAVYHGDPEHVAFLSRVYTAHSQSNPLHPDLWPSATKFEAEIVAMTASMLSAGPASGTPVVGTVSSGGTESILLAMKAYRDHARELRGGSPSRRSSRRSPRTRRSTRRPGSLTCGWCVSRWTRVSGSIRTSWPPR